METSSGKVALLVLFLIQVSLQATIQHQKGPVAEYQELLQSLGMTQEEFRLVVAGNDHGIKNKVMDILKTMQPTQKFSAEESHHVPSLASDNPLIEMDTPQLIRYYGYPVETHYVTTEDGFNLEIHRIPFGKNGNEPGVVREPIIVQHGILCSSADWVVNPPEQAFGFMLADAGYDVWMPNIRGNTYSKTNTHMSNKEKDFWMWSWNEMGDYDMPAIIDYILYHTGFPQLYYSGHSMGTTMFFVMMDKHPEYNDKVRAFFALAPVATVDNMKSPVRLTFRFMDSLEWFFDTIRMYEFLPSSNFMDFLARFLCEDDDFTQFICSNIMFLLGGYNSKQMNETMLPVYIAHTPAGTSQKTLVHYGQVGKTGIFRHFDHGKDNMDWYGTDEPPLYDISKTTVDTYFYWGENDWLTQPVDVMEAAGYIPNLKLLFRVNDAKWSHLDFMWGIQANTLLYEPLIKTLSTMSIDLKKNEV